MEIYLNKEADLEERAEDLLSKLTIEEKIILLRGKNFWTTNPIPRLKIPAFGMTDGPLGVAMHSSSLGKRTRFPASIGVAATWNKNIAYEMGKAIGRETKLAGRHQILGPGVNLIRSPLCGRNFEYLSEDPILSSDIASEIVKGIQSEKAASCIKHYIANNSETKRMRISSEISERTLQEIYVKNYKRIIERADPWGLMASYNQVNGISVVENKNVLREILRDQLGFTGHVVSDWGATRKASEGALGCIKAGLSLEMPGILLSNTLTPRKVRKLLKSGLIEENDIDYVIRPLLRTFFRVELFENQIPKAPKIIDIPEHQELARKIAEESMVLLKNQNQFLPIDIDKVKKITILGPNANKIFGKFLNGGSSAVVPPRFITPLQGISDYVKGKVKIIPEPENADIVFLILGLDNGGSILKTLFSKREADAEGMDRTTYKLPNEQLRLFNETIEKNPNTVVILIAGSPIDCAPFLEKAPALLNAWYPGMMGGDALARIIFGDANPSGKLPVTYPKKLIDHPAHLSKDRFPGDLKKLKIYYDEEIYIGYRYFDKNNIEPQFPFGFGLSYTQFEISNIKVDKKTIQRGESFVVSVDVKNIGDYEGSEVIQVYISDKDASVDRPPKELQGFEKILLSPGEVKTVSLKLNDSSLEFYSEVKKKFITEAGNFTIWVGTSSRDLPLKVTIEFEE